MMDRKRADKLVGLFHILSALFILCFHVSMVLLRRLNIAPSCLPKSPSAALSSIAVALAAAQSSALHMKICSAQSDAIFNRRSNISRMGFACTGFYFYLRKKQDEIKNLFTDRWYDKKQRKENREKRNGMRRKRDEFESLNEKKKKGNTLVLAVTILAICFSGILYAWKLQMDTKYLTMKPPASIGYTYQNQV